MNRFWTWITILWLFIFPIQSASCASVQKPGIVDLRALCEATPASAILLETTSQVVEKAIEAETWQEISRRGCGEDRECRFRAAHVVLDRYRETYQTIERAGEAQRLVAKILDETRACKGVKLCRHGYQQC